MLMATQDIARRGSNITLQPLPPLRKTGLWPVTPPQPDSGSDDDEDDLHVVRGLLTPRSAAAAAVATAALA